MKLDATATLATLVETFLTRGTTNKIIHFTLQLRHDAYPPSENEICHFCFLHFVVYRGSNYTQVLWAVTDKSSVMPKQVFTRSSRHDSAWRNDGINRIIEEVNTDARELLAEEYLQKTGEEIPENGIHESCKLGFGLTDGIELIDATMLPEGGFDSGNIPKFELSIHHDDQPNDQPRITRWTLYRIQ